MAKPPRVEVEWVDIEDDPRWQDLTEAAKRECPVCYTAGWLVGIRADALVIAPTINSDACSTTTIPRGCVTALRKLRRDGHYAVDETHRADGKGRKARNEVS